MFLVPSKGEKEIRRLIFLACMLFLMSGSFLMAQDVRYNFDSKADFTKFKTYKWVDRVPIRQIHLCKSK